MSSGINALYESRNGAQAAMATLIAAGIPDAAIRLVVGPLPLRPTAPRREILILTATRFVTRLGKSGCPGRHGLPTLQS
jgi:hypothetical protein